MWQPRSKSCLSPIPTNTTSHITPRSPFRARPYRTKQQQGLQESWTMKGKGSHQINHYSLSFRKLDYIYFKAPLKPDLPQSIKSHTTEHNVGVVPATGQTACSVRLCDGVEPVGWTTTGGLCIGGPASRQEPTDHIPPLNDVCGPRWWSS